MVYEVLLLFTVVLPESYHTPYTSHNMHIELQTINKLVEARKVPKPQVWFLCYTQVHLQTVILLCEKNNNKKHEVREVYNIAGTHGLGTVHKYKKNIQNSSYNPCCKILIIRDIHLSCQIIMKFHRAMPCSMQNFKIVWQMQTVTGMWDSKRCSRWGGGDGFPFPRAPFTNMD